MYLSEMSDSNGLPSNLMPTIGRTVERARRRRPRRTSEGCLPFERADTQEPRHELWIRVIFSPAGRRFQKSLYDQVRLMQGLDDGTQGPAVEMHLSGASIGRGPNICCGLGFKVRTPR